MKTRSFVSVEYGTADDLNDAIEVFVNEMETLGYDVELQADTCAVVVMVPEAGSALSPTRGPAQYKQNITVIQTIRAFCFETDDTPDEIPSREMSPTNSKES